MSSISEVTQKIKDFIINEAGMDKVGIAPMDRFNGSPEGYHPTDFLPGCKSVIAFCVKLPYGAVQSRFRTYEDKLLNTQGIYGTYGYSIGPNFHLNIGMYMAARFIEDLTGEAALPCPCGPLQGPKLMSMRHCAVAAGLGEFGWHSIVLTPEWGSRQRFAVVLTTAELEPSPMYDGPKICKGEACGVCSRVCRGFAIQKPNPDLGRHVKIGDKEYVYNQTNWNQCRVACHSLVQSVIEPDRVLFDWNKTPFPTSEEVNPGVLADENLAYGNPRKAYNFPQHSISWRCGLCQHYCPAGDWKKHYYETGLSTGHPIVDEDPRELED